MNDKHEDNGTPRVAYDRNEVAKMFGRTPLWVWRKVQKGVFPTIPGVTPMMIPTWAITKLLNSAGGEGLD